MVKKSKLFQKVLSSSKNVRFDEFIALLEGFGFVLERTRGSHHIFSHPEIPELFTIQPKRNRQAKPYQMRQFLKLVEQFDLKLKED